MRAVTWKRADNGLIFPAAPGVYIAPGQNTPLAARASMLSTLLPEDVVVARRTAAWIWGLDVLPPGTKEAQWPVDVITDPIDPTHIVTQSGVRVTTLTRTALDCTRWLPRLEALAALDQFLRRDVDLTELKSMAQALQGQPNAARLLTLLRLGDPGAASPAESWTRLIVMDAGFPRPQTQIPVPGPHNANLYVDLGYTKYRVGIEYDGEQHHTGQAARTRDHHRRRWLATEKGWEIIPLTKEFLYTPKPYLAALLTTLQTRGWTPTTPQLTKLTTHLSR
ncbi:hypothetical protein [Spirillospora sp. CA-294931]|uniref:hypothetical protein n=1 Tax=Spirillospora sp. CA-294931 TaxID=3240042 RepID=UPI003D925AAB